MPSDSQRFEFRAISSETIAAKLALICETEGIKASQEALDIIAHIAEGGMRDAQSTLDQLITFCGTDITKDDVTTAATSAALSPTVGADHWTLKLAVFGLEF